MAADHEMALSSGTAQPSAWIDALSLWTVRAIRWVAWAAAALAMLGFGGSMARAADLASHFRVVYVLAMLPAVATYVPSLTRGRWRSALLSLVLALDVGAIAALYMPSRSHPETGPNEPTIRLLQFNTWFRNQDDKGVLSLVEADRPDVASLQETTESLRESLSTRLADRYRFLSAGSELLLIRRDARSIEVRNWTRHILPGGEAIEAHLDAMGRRVAVLSLHAMAPVGLAQAAIRDAQFEWVARWCRAQSEPLFILGDLNTTPWSHSFRRLLREGGLLDSTQGFGVQPTWRTSYGPLGGVLAWPLRIPIDHCLHSPALVTVARQIGPACGSNHYSLLVSLRFTEFSST